MYSVYLKSGFDPNDMGSQTAIAATSSQDGSLATFLLKDDNSGNYAIYTLSQYKAEEGYYEDPDNWEGWIVTSPEQPAAAKKQNIFIPTTGKNLTRQSCIYFSSDIQIMYYM